MSAQRTAIAKRPPRALIVAGVLLLLGLGVSAWIGFSDGGAISVNERIDRHNETVRSEVTAARERGEEPASEVKEVARQNTDRRPNGGLRGRGVGSGATQRETPAEPENELANEQGTSTASTTGAVAGSATSTESEAGSSEAATSTATSEAPSDATTAETDAPATTTAADATGTSSATS